MTTSVSTPENAVLHVLGCGPAALMSAHAALSAGFNVSIHGKKRKSEMFGAQYLHEAIPGISEPEDLVTVNYVLQGTEDDYRKKVYGENHTGSVSPEDLLGTHPGWDIRAAYDRLWLRFADTINHVEFKESSDIALLMSKYSDHDIWASTIPAPFLCAWPDRHAFSSQKIWAIGDAPERGIFCPVRTQPDTEVCNGEKEPGWYRASTILGYSTAEWPEGRKPPIEGITEIIKPLDTTCDCLPRIHRLGRYGKWKKGVLSHTAFTETFNGLSVDQVALPDGLA